MSNNRDLLKEAIADAKAVKETAIANAKAALEEAFTPHLKSMLAAKLEEMDKEDVDEGYDKYEEDDMTEEVSEEVEAVEENEEVNESDEVTEAEEVDEEVNLDELLAELNEDEEVTESEEIDEAKKDDEKDEVKEAKKDDEKEEVKESEEIEESEEVTEEEEVEDEIEVEDEEAEGEMEDEELDLEDMSEDDLKGFIEDVIRDMVESGELEAGEEFEAEGGEEIEVEDDMEDVMMEEKEELEEMDEVSWNEKNNPTRGASKKELDPKKVGKSTSAYAVNLEEAMAEVEELKKELQEVNLLNAKLLYTNKIFKSKNLSEDKKLKVLKAFDNASTVKEAKVVFETLNEGIADSAKKSINEIKGSASKATGTAPTAKQPIVESDVMVERFKKLAGII